MKKIFLALMLFCSSIVSAKTPLTIVVGFPPGGDTDVIARVFATRLASVLDRPVVVENRVGASGSIAANHVASAAPDGSVILLAPSTFVTAPLVNSNIRYNPIDDFVPLMQISGHGMLAVVAANTGIKNIKDLIESHKNNGVNHYGSPGVGSPMHILGEMFNQESGSTIIHVPYKGNSEVVTNMLGNQLPFTWITILPVLQHIELGKLTPIGIASSKRSSFYPNVPTLKEQGINIEVESWLGFVGPRGMSRQIQNDLNIKLNEVIALPEVQEKLKSMAMLPIGSKPEHFANTIKRDTVKYTQVIKKIGIKN